MKKMRSISIEADGALRKLKAGHNRFLNQKRILPHLSKYRMAETFRKGQKPFAAVLTCSDSRVPVEHIFDVGVGDLFVVRVAGNICSEDELGSLEFAVDALAVPLIVVLGHTRCGAVKAACQGGGKNKAVAVILEKIRPAVARAKKTCLTNDGDELIDKMIIENIGLAIENLLACGKIIENLFRQAVASGCRALFIAWKTAESNGWTFRLPIGC